jgi:hypothetical protein
MTAKFTKQQQEVKVVDLHNDYLNVFICVNPREVTEKYEIDEDGKVTEKEETYIEYDYNEFSDKAENLDVDDIKANPEKYLDYPFPVYTELDKLRADVDYLLMLEE